MKKVIKYIPLLLTAVIMSGCLKDSFENVSGKDGFIEIEFEMAVEDEELSLTRAFSPEQEDWVETIDVLVFEYDTSVSGYGKFRYSTHGYDIRNTDGSKAKKFKVMLATEYTDGGTTTSLTGKQIFLLILANSREVWYQHKGSVPVDATVRSVVDRLVFMQPGNWDTSSGSTQYFPMTSVPLTHPVVSGNLNGSDFGTISLKRAVAAIDIGFNYGGGTTPQSFSDFELEEVILCNTTDRGFVSNTTDYGGYYQPYVPNTHQLIERSYTLASPSGYGIFNEIYVPERDMVNVDLNPEQRPYILIRGKYNGGDSWYKVEFPLSGSSSAYSMKMHRNWRYIVKIDKIEGPGYATREEAEVGEIKDPRLWMNLTVVPFSQRTVPAELDGPYKFDVSQTEFYFSNDADLNVINLYTDYSGGWKVDDITYDVDPGSNFWLRTSAIKGNPFIHEPLLFAADKNNTGKGRIGWIHLSAGRWKYKIKVQQGEVTPMSVIPTSRTISFWSHHNGATPQNTFAVHSVGTDWEYSVSYPSGQSDWDLTVHKTADGRRFYVQCDRNQTIGVRRANVTVTSGFQSITIPITQDWADCGIGGNVAMAEFGGEQPQVKTHLFGTNHSWNWSILLLEKQLGKPFEEWAEETKLWWLEKIEESPKGENYACWMVENSRYGNPDEAYYEGVDPANDASKYGPYYSAANAPGACPEGWKLPGYYEMMGIMNMFGPMQNGIEWYNAEDEELAWEIWIEDPNTFAGYRGIKPDNGNNEWLSWGKVSYFYSDWDGKTPSGKMIYYTTPIVLTSYVDTSNPAGFTVTHRRGFDANSLWTVRCVKDKIYTYE